MSEMEIEFRNILKQNTPRVESNKTPYSTCVTANAVKDFEKHSDISPADLSRLRTISEQLSRSAGGRGRCVSIYKTTREDFMEACLKKLGVQQLTVDSVKSMRRDQVELMIDDCKRAAKVFLLVLFPREKSLCDRIFCGPGAADPFLEVIEEFAAQLFDFAEALSYTPPSHENLIKILALHDGLTEVLPEVDLHFKSGKLRSMRKKAHDTVKKLARVAKGVLSELPDKVLKSNVSTNHPDDPALPRYVIKTIMIPMVSTYRNTLSGLIGSKPEEKSYDLAAKIELGLKVEGETTRLSLHLRWIIVNLVYNLRGTSRSLYKDNKDASQRHLFTMKNMGYVIEKIEGCPQLKEMVGDEFLLKLTKKFHQAIEDYLKSISENISRCLKLSHFYNSNSTLAENLGKFNDAFVVLRRSVATIVVSDAELRERYRESVVVTLVQPYSSFYGRLQSRNIPAKYSPGDLEARINNNFFRAAPHRSLDW